MTVPLNMNGVTICREKYIGIVTLKVLLTSCFHYNSEEKGIKLLIPKMKLNIINKYEFPYASCIIKCLEGFEGMTNF